MENNELWEEEAPRSERLRTIAAAVLTGILAVGGLAAAGYEVYVADRTARQIEHDIQNSISSNMEPSGPTAPATPVPQR